MILRLCQFQLLQVPNEKSVFKNFTNSHYTTLSKGNVSLICLPTKIWYRFHVITPLLVSCIYQMKLNCCIKLHSHHK
jgi:hypothetical protein